MRAKSRLVGAIAALPILLTVVVALSLTRTGSAQSPCPDDQGCTGYMGYLVLTNWGQAQNFYGKSAVHAGPNDETTLNGDGLFADEVDVNSVSADDVSAGLVGAFTVEANQLFVSGTKNFKIDHPLDPTNRYLTHSSVESPDIKNIYDGVATLDASGAALIVLPEWFEALNRDFRYQLTAIGAPAGNLYVAGEISNNRFKVAGGTPNLRVSWQVTGIRHDRSALKGARPIEELKRPEDRGRYVDPAAFGELESLRIGHANRPMRAKPMKTSAQQPAASGALACVRNSAQKVKGAFVPLSAFGLTLGGVLFLRSTRKRASAS